VALARHRRLELLQWAGRSGAWIVEDDYLAELHLSGRPAPALASGQGADRVIYIGSFSKTISPITGIGFMVAPPPLTRRLIEVTACLGASPNAAAQLAIARFLQEGHYLRHLRRMRHLYAQRQKCLLDTLAQLGVGSAVAAGLSVLLPLPNGFDDQRLAREALVAGFGPAPLSPWFSRASRPYSGLILGVANVIEKKIEGDCRRLLAMTGDPSGIVGRATLPASLRPEPHGTPER
jgi:GntR family transcriptional regulator/MocR family aminotransferase